MKNVATVVQLRQKVFMVGLIQHRKVNNININVV